MKPLMLKKETEALAALKADLGTKHLFRWMKLIGSKARGDFDEESDLDVVIVLEQVDWRIERDVFESCFYIGLKYDVLISPTVYSKQELDMPLTRITPFYLAVEAEGVLV